MRQPALTSREAAVSELIPAPKLSAASLPIRLRSSQGRLIDRQPISFVENRISA
jgi:hypothetical protein